VGFELHERPPFDPQPLLALDDWPPCPLELDLHHVVNGGTMMAIDAKKNNKDY